MNRYKYLTFLLITIIFYSCQDNNQKVPENNEFSYLETSVTGIDEERDSIESETEPGTYDCEPIHTELIGNILIKNIGNGQFPILKLTKPFELSCSNDIKINGETVILKSNENINFEQYLGGTAIAVGEIGLNSDLNSDIQLEMDVIRIEVAKGIVN